MSIDVMNMLMHLTALTLAAHLAEARTCFSYLLVQVNTVFATNAYALLWMTPVGAMPTSYSGFTMDVLLANHPLVDAGEDAPVIIM